MTTTANPTPEALRNGSTRTARLLIRPWKHEDAADAFVTRSFPECYTQTSYEIPSSPSRFLSLSYPNSLPKVST